MRLSILTGPAGPRMITDGARPSHACPYGTTMVTLLNANAARASAYIPIPVMYYSEGFFLRAATSASLASLSDNLLAIAAAFRAARSSASAALASSAALAASAAAF